MGATSRNHIDQIRADWTSAICSGAPPFSRLRDPVFHPEQSSQGDQAARAWLEVIAGGLNSTEPIVLQGLGLNESELALAFGSAHLREGQALPAWMESLVGFVQALPQQQIAHGASADSTDVATDVFLAATVSLLDWHRLAHDRPGLDARLLPHLSRQLATRVLLSCGATLELEYIASADTLWDFSREAWLDRLCGFTGLNFVVGTAVRQWKQNAKETLRRVTDDLPRMERVFFHGKSVGAVVAIDGDLGDRHNDGRSVSVLTFESGDRIVYKPKGLRCAKHFLDLLTATLPTVDGDNLKLQTLLCRGSYTWEEYVEQWEARTTEEAGRFFRHYGMLLRALQLVEGRDFWIDNLRVAGDQPVFVDFECILHGRIAGTGFQVSMPGLDPRLFEESVIATAAVTQPVTIPGFGKQDFGGLSASGPRLLPLGVWSGYRDRISGNLWLHSGRLYWTPEVAWPHPDNQAADPAQFLDELEYGYRAMQTQLQNSVPRICDATGPVAGLAQAPVRVLLRSTWEYLVLLRASLEPSALLDGNARELALANILATAHKWGSEQDLERRLNIAKCELDAIRVLDIPEFTHLPSGTSVSSGDTTIPDVFTGAAHDRLQERLTTLASFDIETHVQVLRTAVTSMCRTTA